MRWTYPDKSRCPRGRREHWRSTPVCARTCDTTRRRPDAGVDGHRCFAVLNRPVRRVLRGPGRRSQAAGCV